LNNIVTLKVRLEMAQGHWNWYHRKLGYSISILSPSMVTMTIL